jgi:hypothetical protein
MGRLFKGTSSWNGFCFMHTCEENLIFRYTSVNEISWSPAASSLRVSLHSLQVEAQVSELCVRSVSKHWRDVIALPTACWVNAEYKGKVLIVRQSIWKLDCLELDVGVCSVTGRQISTGLVTSRCAAARNCCSPNWRESALSNAFSAGRRIDRTSSLLYD